MRATKLAITVKHLPYSERLQARFTIPYTNISQIQW